MLEIIFQKIRRFKNPYTSSSGSRSLFGIFLYIQRFQSFICSSLPFYSSPQKHNSVIFLPPKPTCPKIITAPLAQTDQVSECSSSFRETIKKRSFLSMTKPLRHLVLPKKARERKRVHLLRGWSRPRRVVGPAESAGGRNPRGGAADGWRPPRRENPSGKGSPGSHRRTTAGGRLHIASSSHLIERHSSAIAQSTNNCGLSVPGTSFKSDPLLRYFTRPDRAGPG